MPALSKKQAKCLISQDKKSIYVGMDHNAEFQVSPLVADQLLATGKKYGFWYEGGGGDADKVKRVLGNISYEGSWDKLLKSDSPAFYYAMFSNSKKGTSELINKLEAPSKTVLDVLVEAGDKVAHEALQGRTSNSKLVSFLQECSPSLLTFAKTKQATKSSLKEFFTKGEALMWPSNWREGPTSASRLALEANKTRLKTIIDREGVFFLGADHLQTLRSMAPKLKLLTETLPNGD